MHRTTIICEDCGAPSRGPRHKKKCNECRLMAELEYWTGRLGTCRKDYGGCGQSFNPVRRGDPVCGSCTPGRDAHRGTCALCNQEDTYRLVADIAVCEVCARSTAKRILFIRGLRARQRARRAANATPEAAHV